MFLEKIPHATRNYRIADVAGFCRPFFTPWTIAVPHRSGDACVGAETGEIAVSVFLAGEHWRSD